MGEELKKKRIIAVVVFNLILLKKWDFNLTEKHNHIVLNYSNALHPIDSRDTAAFIIIVIKYVDSEIDSPKPL